MQAYATLHPAAFKQLESLLIGETSRELAKIMEKFVESIPFVEFTPVVQKT